MNEAAGTADLVAKNNEHIALFDNVKGILIILVVIGHFIEPYVDDSHFFKSLFLFIYSFHMPLFIFVAGCFHKNEQVKERVIGFLSIYLAFKVVIAVSKAVCAQQFTISILSEDGSPWFMFAMAVFICAAYTLRDVNIKVVLFLTLTLSCCAGYDKTFGDFLVASRIIVFFPFYYAGKLFSREMAKKLAGTRKYKIFGCLVLLIWLVICYFQIDLLYILRHLFTGRNPYNDTVRPLGWLFRSGCYVLSAVVGLSVIAAASTKKLGYLTTIGSRTLQIYFWHIPIRNILYHIGWMDKLMTVGTVGKLLLILSAMGIAFILSAKPFAQPTSYLIKISKNKLAHVGAKRKYT